MTRWSVSWAKNLGKIQDDWEEKVEARQEKVVAAENNFDTIRLNKSERVKKFFESEIQPVLLAQTFCRSQNDYQSMGREEWQSSRYAKHGQESL